jgi:hypothetical protein
MTSCRCCGLIQEVPTIPPGHVASCCRCRTTIVPTSGASGNAISAALALAALVLFVPAISLPFLRIEQLGHTSEDSLLTGVVSLISHGQVFVGLVVLIFSVILPPVKLVALLVVTRTTALAARHRAATYRLIEHLGRWGMLDVLLVAVLIAFIKLGNLIQFQARPGMVVFGLFVLLSLLASGSFHPHALWEEESMNQAGPVAVVERRRRARWLWIVPMVALVAAGVASYLSWGSRGPVIKIAFADGHGIKTGDVLRHHGIAVGQVEQVVLSEDLGGADIRVRLDPQAQKLARQGSRFWIVRPRINLSGVEGLETIIGAKYLAVLPGPEDAAAATTFVGIEDPPLVDMLEPGGREIVLVTPNPNGLGPGVPVLYRNLRVGGVIDVRLAADGSAAEARVYIQPRYKQLVRDNTKFWNASGLKVSGGVTGMSLQLGTLETVLQGGVAMAVPPESGKEAADGAHFTLYDQPIDDWLEWKPILPSQPAPRDLPRLARAVLKWTQRSFLGWNNHPEQSGWVLPVADGLVGPAELLTVPSRATSGAELILSSQTVSLPQETKPAGEGLAFLPLEKGATIGPAARFRHASAPEDVFLVTDGETRLFIAAARLTSAERHWLVDPALPIEPSWQGAAAVSGKDGAVLGVLLVDRKAPKIAWIEQWQ